MKLFIDVFHQAYGGATPDEPYGALPKEYGECLINSFTNPLKGKTTIHYLGLLNGIAVGIATLFYSEKFGCITNVGVVSFQRKKGIGALLTINAIADSIKNKAEIVFLYTEEGSINEKYYQKLGFSTKFIGESFLLDALEYGVYQTVNSCVKIKPNENVVILTDNKIKAVAARIADAVKKITPNIKTYTLNDYGKRPFKIPPFILEDIKKSDAAFVITEYIYGDMPVLYEPVNGAVTKSRTRMAALVDIDESLLKDGMNADYEKIGKFSKKIYRIVKNAKKIRVITDLGTDITVTLGYKWAVFDGIPRPGKWVNLPDGEVLTAPKNVDGVVVVDGSIEFLGILTQHPMKIEIKDGFAQKESVSCARKEIKDKFTELVFTTDENSSRVGEFAFGTNLFLKNLSGNLLQDEKFPSIHIAFGDPHGSLTGAKWRSNNHMDAIILKPTVFVDDVKVMEKENIL
ncbi:MAG: aminopeptidase [Nanoarchaeota archaeon]